MKLKVWILFSLIAILPLISIAQAEKKKNSGTFNFFFENDLFAGTDHQYTGGLGLTWISPDLTDNRENFLLSKWIYSLTKRLFFVNKQEYKHAISISIGQNIYTPDDIERSDLIKEDRPYAGIAYVGFGFYSQSSHHMDTLELDLGIVGPHSYAEELQKLVHKLVNASYLYGWHNQLKDEFALAVSYDHKWKLLRSEIAAGLGYDLIMHTGGGLGNIYTGAFTGIEARFGWHMPNDFGTFLIRRSGNKNDVYDKQNPYFIYHDRFGIHFFAAVDGQVILRKIFLDGNTFLESHRVEKRPFSANIMAGVALTINRFKISYTHVYQTKYFITQRNEHLYGSLNLSFSY